MLSTRTDDPNVHILILCNAIGSPVDSKYIGMEPQYIAMTDTHIIAASSDLVCVWQYSTKVNKLTSIDTAMDGVALKKKDGKEVVWHADENPSGSAGDAGEHPVKTQNTRFCLETHFGSMNGKLCRSR